MFVSKRKYEELEKKLRDAEDKLIASESIRKEVEEMLKKYKSNEHECDAMCEGCQHLIDSKEIHVSPYAMGGYREYTKKLCALDRTCKDFQAKECVVNEQED